VASVATATSNSIISSANLGPSMPKASLKCTAIPGSASVSKELDGHGWNCQQEGDQD
jgi:hypothetical protein